MVESVLFLFFIFKLHLKGSSIFGEWNFKLFSLLLLNYLKAWFLLLKSLFFLLLLRNNRILLRQIILNIFIKKFFVKKNVYFLRHIEKWTHKSTIFDQFFAI
jgi:hypothetical protein